MILFKNNNPIQAFSVSPIYLIFLQSLYYHLAYYLFLMLYVYYLSSSMGM